MKGDITSINGKWFVEELIDGKVTKHECGSWEEADKLKKELPDPEVYELIRLADQSPTGRVWTAYVNQPGRAESLLPSIKKLGYRCEIGSDAHQVLNSKDELILIVYAKEKSDAT